MSVSVRIVLFFLVLVVLFELFTIYILRKLRRSEMYVLAEQRSNITGKPILVIGDPYNDNKSVNGAADYGCGNVCLDLTGCPLCPVGVKRRLEDYLPSLKSDSYVIFASCVLEYVDDFDRISKELIRVSGGDLFIVAIESHTLKTNLFPNLGYQKFKRKRIIYAAPPFSKDIVYKELP